MNEEFKNNDDDVDRSSVSRNQHGEDQDQNTTLNPTITPKDDDKYSQLHSQNELDKEWNLELEQEYVDEEDLKRIAESLAPRVTSLLDSNEAALEETLAKDEELWTTSNYDTSGYFDDNEDNDDDDEDDDGLEQLRQELEASHGDWGSTSILTDPCSVGQQDPPPHTPLSKPPSTNTFDTQVQHGQEPSKKLFPSSNSSFDSHPSDTLRVVDNPNDETNNNNNTQTYTIYDHAKYLNLQFDDTDLGYPTCPLVNTQHVQLFLESLDYLNTEGSASEPLHMQQQLDNQDTTYDSNTTHTLIKTSKSRDEMIQGILLCNKEYIKPMSNDGLSRIYEGISGLSSSQHPWYEQDVKKLRNKKRKNRADISIKDVNGKPIPHGNSELLPVRTISIQIRPDVLCGAVMDAVYSALHSMDAEVTKRQGGHLRALVPGTWIPEPSYSHFKPFGANQGYGMAQMFGSPTLLPQLMSDGMVFVPPFVVDVQLCMKRSSRTAERILLTRIYPISPGQILDDGIVCPDTSTEKPLSNTMEQSSSHSISMESDRNNWNLRETASLFQRMRDVAKSGGTLGFSAERRSDDNDYDSNAYSTPKPKSMIRNVLTSPLRLFSPSKPTNTPKRNKPTLNFVRFDAEENVFKGVDSARTLVTEKLISQFTVTPSILDDMGDIEPIPSLSFVDWPYIQSSWRFVKSCLNELESRNLAYRYVF
jgi:hypothetical protein